ncbi:MAG: hypothetical protein ACTSVE_14690 [Candidatus Helarchaeota archaeon]
MTKKRRTSKSRTKRRKGASKTHELTQVVKIFTAIGCILIILTSILQIMAAFGFASFPLYNTGIVESFGLVMTAVILIIFAIINLVLAILLLAGLGLIEWEKYLAVNFLILILIGIVTILLGAFFGGACLIIAGIIDIIGLLIR